MKRSDLLIEGIVEEPTSLKVTTKEGLSEKEPISFFEYVIEGNKIEEREMRGYKKTRGCFYVYAYRDEKRIGNGRFIYASEFDIINRNRIYAYEKDYPKYSKLLIRYVEERVEKLRKQLEEQEQKLVTLKKAQ